MEYGENPQYRGRWGWLSYCFPIGSFSGVPIGLHWTWPLMFAIYVTKASQYGAVWAWTIALSILSLFVIVLFHEFSHVFSTKRV